MHKKLLTCSFMLAYTSIAIEVGAQTGGGRSDWSPPLETILVTASRLESEQVEQSSLSREEIELLGAGASTGLLRAVPHLYLFENGGPGGIGFAAVRGGDANFLLVMIDGIIVNDPTGSRGGGFDFNQIDPAAIESIELYRGGVSAQYGGEALSGILHIRTRSSSGTEIALAAGNEGQERAAVSLSKRANSGTSVMMTAAHNALDRSDQQNYDNQQALFKLEKSGDRAAGSLLASISDQKAAAYPEDSGGELSTIGLPEERDSRQLLLGARARVRITGNLSANLQATRSEHDEDVDSPGIAPGELNGVPPTSIGSTFEQTTVDANLATEPVGGLRFLLGAAYRDSVGRNDGFVDFGFPIPVDYTLEQQTLSTYGELSYNAPDWSLIVGGRYDSPDEFDGEPSFRLRWSMAVSESLDLQASYSEGFKLPSFFALANPLVGNPELQPEYSELISLGVGFNPSSTLRIGATYFDNEYRNLVDFDPELFTNVNRTRVLAEGLELDLQWQINESLSLLASAAHLDADSASDGAPLRRRPSWLSQVQANYAHGDLEGFVAIRHRSSFLDSSQLTGLQTLPGYSRLDLGLHWSPSNDWRLSINVDNVTDEILEDAIGFRDTGTLLRLGVSYAIR